MFWGGQYQGSDDTPVLPDEGNEPSKPDTPSTPQQSSTPNQTPFPTQQPSASQQTPTPTQQPVSDRSLSDGTTLEVNHAAYVVKDAAKKTVEYKMPSKTTIKSVTIPNTIKVTVDGKPIQMKVTGISANAFKKCSKLQKVVIGQNVQSIGKKAFFHCKKLKNIIIKSTKLESVGRDAIKGIHKKAVIRCGKKKKAYQKLFAKKTGYKKFMKIKK